MLWLVAMPLAAQGGVAGGIEGQVTDSAGRPVGDALIVVRLEGQAREVRTDTAGAYAVPGLAPGRWSVHTRSLGFAPDSAVVVVGAGVTRHNVRLQRVFRLDPRVIAENWTGVRGIVGNQSYEPVPGATVTVVGERVSDRTDAGGAFAIAWAGDKSILLRVQAPGFAPRLVSARIPSRRSVELSVLLDTAAVAVASELLVGEMERRMGWSSPMATFVAREELLRAGTRDARMALESTPSFNARGLVIERNACLFVNGLPRPGFPLDALDPAMIEFIEVYTAESERLGLLASRWPPRAECGAPVTAQAARWVPVQQKVKYVVVWTREPW